MAYKIGPVFASLLQKNACREWYCGININCYTPIKYNLLKTMLQKRISLVSELLGKPLECIYYKSCSADRMAIESLDRRRLVAFFK